MLHITHTVSNLKLHTKSHGHQHTRSCFSQRGHVKNTCSVHKPRLHAYASLVPIVWVLRVGTYWLASASHVVLHAVWLAVPPSMFDSVLDSPRLSAVFGLFARHLLLVSANVEVERRFVVRL